MHISECHDAIVESWLFNLSKLFIFIYINILNLHSFSYSNMSSSNENTSLIFEQAKQVLMQYDSVVKSIDEFDN